MFEILPASSAATETSPTHAMLSVLVHGSLAAAAIMLTAHVTAGPTVHTPVGQMIYIPAPPARPAPGTTATPTDAGGLPAVPFDAPIPGPVHVPPGVPLSIGAPATASGQGVRPTTGLGTATWLGGPSPSGAWAAGEVDDPVRLLVAGRLVYPPVLERAGIAGSVTLDFVVDSVGGVAAATLRVVSASHAGFERAAIEAVLATQFQPARARGRAVRQLVRQQLKFVTGATR